MSGNPGDGFNYNTGNAQLVSAIITKLTGMCALDYEKAKLSIYNAVKSDSSLPADATNAKLLADAILDVSTEKPTPQFQKNRS